MATTPRKKKSEATPVPVQVIKEPVLLEDILVALQKTFSRVSRSTGQRDTAGQTNQACALIVGNVNFEFSLNVEPCTNKSSGVPSNLCYSPNQEGFALKLAGVITTDVRHTEMAKGDEPHKHGTQGEAV